MEEERQEESQEEAEVEEELRRNKKAKTLFGVPWLAAWSAAPSSEAAQEATPPYELSEPSEGPSPDSSESSFSFVSAPSPVPTDLMAAFEPQLLPPNNTFVTIPAGMVFQDPAHPQFPTDFDLDAFLNHDIFKSTTSAPSTYEVSLQDILSLNPIGNPPAVTPLALSPSDPVTNQHFFGVEDLMMAQQSQMDYVWQQEAAMLQEQHEVFANLAKMLESNA